MGGLHRKAEAGLAIILIIVIVLFFFGWLINASQRECKSNRDCSSESYCGSDFSCHAYPNIQKTVIQYNFFWPSLIIGIAIIAAAAIFKWGSIKRTEMQNQAEAYPKSQYERVSEDTDAISEPYYKNEGDAKAP